MDGHTPSNRDETHDVVPRYRVATVGVAGHDILDAPHLDPSYLMGGGLFRVHLRVLLAGFYDFLRQEFRQHLNYRDFAKADFGHQVDRRVETETPRNLAHLLRF